MNNISFSRKRVSEDDGERKLHWIPVTSRLPKTNGNYLITSTEEHVLLSYFDGDFIIDIIAWAELPTPYKL